MPGSSKISDVKGVRLHKTIWARLDDVARMQRRPRNQLIQILLEDALWGGRRRFPEVVDDGGEDES